MNRYLFFLLLLSVLAQGCVFSLPSHRPQTIRWSGSVTVRGDLRIEAGTRLIIQPGTEVLFAAHQDLQADKREHPNFPGSELIVAGSIEAVGTPRKPIIFRSSDPHASPGSWGGVNLEEGASGLFRYSRFQQADSAIHARGASLEIARSVFSDNLVAIRFNTSEILIEENLLEDNEVGIRFHLGSPVICRNLLTDNDKGMFITSHPRNYRIVQNDFVDNRLYQVILGELVPETVSMQRNFWGTTKGREIEASFFDGRVDSYLGIIEYRPVSDTPFLKEPYPWNR